MRNITEILEGVGLSENEAKIYLAILELGRSGMTEIARKSGIKRTTIYSYITPLLEKDYIKRSIVGKRTYFLAENPNNLLKLFEQRRLDFIKSVPLLEGMYDKNTPNPQLEFHEGKMQIKKLYEEIWGFGLDIKAFFSPEKFYQIFGEEFDVKLNKIEQKAGGKTKDLLKNNSVANDHLRLNPLESSKLLPRGFDLDVDIIILGNSVVMISFEPLYAIKIKNKPFADFQRNIFNYFWKVL